MKSGGYSVLFYVTNVIAKVLIREREEESRRSRKRKGDTMMEGEKEREIWKWYTDEFENRRSDHKSKNVACL